MLLNATWVFLVVLIASFAAWRQYLRARNPQAEDVPDDCPYSLSDRFSEHHLHNVPHQRGAKWLHEIFERSAQRFPEHTALHIPSSGEKISYAELNQRAEAVASALSAHLTGPGQVVAVAMEQDSWHIIAAHLGILKAGAAAMFLDTRLPEKLMAHMLADGRPAALLTRGSSPVADIPFINLATMELQHTPRKHPNWLHDPRESLATILYTSGTTGAPKGVECHHAGYVNLALTYADYFELTAGIDATSLISSLGYDGSISEMYSAWVSGCTVVMLSGEEVRSGPGLLPVLREAEVTVLFCPPTLLPTLTSKPEIDLPYPLCRYIVPAGEAFPSSLVEPWTRNRRQIINTYGPTEASTDTSRQSLRPGEPVTIGSPFPNVTYVILPFGGTNALPHGETGELCIGGIHIACGYRNLPELSAEKFIEHPKFGRLYRTGDKCRIDIDRLQVEFLGREDAQVKVRGHRVEIQPIEDALQSRFEDIDAAVVDYRNEELIAFVSAPRHLEPESAGVRAAPPDWSKRVLDELSDCLPAISVPSRIFLVESFVMQPVSGKIDRRRLPELPMTEGGPEPAAGNHSAAGSELSPGLSERGHAEVLATCRHVFTETLGWDDAFVDNGGHSIAIANLSQQLQADGWRVTVRDLLTELDTPRKIALHAERQLTAADEPKAQQQSEFSMQNVRSAASLRLGVPWFTMAQCLLLLLMYAPIIVLVVIATLFANSTELITGASTADFIAVGLLSYLAALCIPMLNLIWVMSLKTLLGGHPIRNTVAPGIYPKWSKAHLWVWFIGRLQALVLRPARLVIRSNVVSKFFLRALGARLGKNVQVSSDVSFSGPLDMLSMGDGVAVQSRAMIFTAQWHDQHLEVGRILLQDQCKIGARAAVSAGVSVGRNTWVTPYTPIREPTGANELWEGSPARCTGKHTRLARTQHQVSKRQHGFTMELLNVVLQLLTESLLIVLPTAMVAWGVSKLIGIPALSSPQSQSTMSAFWDLSLHVLAFGFLTTWFSVLAATILTCLFLRFTRSSPGVYSSSEFRGLLLLYRLKKMNQVQKMWGWSILGQYFRALSGLRFDRVGGSECDVMHNMIPEAVHAGPDVFWAHGCITNHLDHDADHLKLGQLDMPERFFASNGSITEAGQYPNDFLLGVATPCNNSQFRRQMRARRSMPVAVAGHPALRFAVADATGGSDQAPGFTLFLLRILMFDILKIGAIPTAEIIFYTVSFLVLQSFGLGVVGSALLALVMTELLLPLLCLALKICLVGRWGSDAIAPFWSIRHFTYFFSQDCFFGWCSNSINLFAGTLLPNTFLRLMGCRIGKRTLITSPLQAFDWNAINLGQDCVADGVFQLHSFENMMLKVKQSRIGDNCCIGPGACIMGGVTLDDGSSLNALSLVLKDMQLPTGSYEGSPAVACRSILPSPGR